MVIATDSQTSCSGTELPATTEAKATASLGNAWGQGEQVWEMVRVSARVSEKKHMPAGGK